MLECVGSIQTLTTSFGVVRAGGIISRVGVPSYTDGPIGMDMIMRNITLTGGVNPARHYIDGILPDVLEGRIEPGRVFDRTVGLDGVPGGYRAMAGSPSKSSSPHETPAGPGVSEPAGRAGRHT